MKKLFVVSDIHGHCTLLKAALQEAGFDPHNENHLLVGCGDYFDRGDENLQVLQFLDRIENKILLRGNHEDLLLKLLQTGKLLPHHYINGTLQTLQDFFGRYAIDPGDDTIDFSGKSRMADRVCEFIQGTVDCFETEHYLFVHGWLPENNDRSPAGWEKARWTRWTAAYDGTPPLPGKTLVCGHVPTFVMFPDTAEIFYGNGMIAIDAGTFDSGKINVLVLEDELLPNA